MKWSDLCVSLAALSMAALRSRWLVSLVSDGNTAVWRGLFGGILCLLVIAFPFLRADSNAQDQVITVVFRYDDYCSDSPTKIERRVIDVFQAIAAPVTFGVVPYAGAGNWHDSSLQEVKSLSEKKAALLRRAIVSGTVEPALHGYSHVTSQDCERGGCSEFSGLGYYGQMEKLSQGKTLLEETLGTEVTIFIPPWNSYDEETLRCVEDLAFDVISADLRGVTNPGSSLRFLPATCSVPELRQAVESARRSSDPRPTIVVLLHGYEFIEVDAQGRFTLDDLSELLDWLVLQRDVHVSSMRHVAEQHDTGPNLFWANKRCYAARRLLPPVLRDRLGPSQVYFSSGSVAGMGLRWWVAVAGLSCATFLVSARAAFLAGVALFRRFAGLGRRTPYCALAAFTFLSVYVLHDLEIYYRGLMALVAVSGMCTGLSLVALRDARPLHKLRGGGAGYE